MRASVQSVIESLGADAGVAFAVRLPDGSNYRVHGEPRFTLCFRSESAVLATITRGHMGLLEGYFDQQVDVEGDFGAALAAGMNAGFDRRFNVLAGVENNLHEWRYSNRDPTQAKANARAHYGLGVEFYRRWLDDPLMMYTCAYWPDGTENLEQAQRQKIDHVCRKLRLAPGEHFVDVGCGFGGFMFRALEQTRRARHRLEHDDRTGGLACARRSRAGASARSCACARPIFVTSIRPTTRWCRSACSSTPAATSCPR